MMIHTDDDRNSNVMVKYLKTHMTEAVRINIRSRAAQADLEAQNVSAVVYKCSQNHPMQADELVQLYSYVKSEVERLSAMI